MAAKKIFLFLVLSSFLFLNALAQHDSIAALKQNEQTIEFYGDAYFASSAIANDFILAFYKGKFIENNIKDNSSSRLSRSNRMGGVSKIGLTYLYQSLQEQDNPVFSFSFFDRTNVDVKFSDDLFHMIFYGNKNFAGETAQLGNFQLNFLRYQQFRFGWKWNGDAIHGSYGFAFSLLSGEQNIFAKASTANLYTSPDGQFIDLSIAMQMQQTDSIRNKYFAQNGIGLSTDFFYEMPYLSWNKRGKAIFEVNDFGLIRWNSNSMAHSVDSSFHYEGVNVNNVLNTNGGAIPKLTGNRIINSNTHFDQRQYTSSLPFYFNIRTRTWYGNQFSFEKGISFLFNSSAKPYYFMKFHFCTRNKKAELCYTVGYGGYGRLSAGIEAKVDFAKHYSLFIADNYLFSGITPHTASGLGLCVRLARKFP